MKVAIAGQCECVVGSFLHPSRQVPARAALFPKFSYPPGLITCLGALT